MVFLTRIVSDEVELEYGIFISTEMGGVISEKIEDGSIVFNKDLYPVRLPFKDRSSVFYGSTDHIIVDEKKWIDYGLPLQYSGENLTNKKIVVFPMHGLGDQLYLAVTIRNIVTLYPGIQVTIVKPSLASAEQWYPYIYFDDFYDIKGPVISVEQMVEFDYYIDVEHFAHLSGYNGTFPPLFYAEHLFCHSVDCIKDKRPLIDQDVAITLKSGNIDGKIDELRKTGKPVVFVNPVSTGRVRDIPEKTLMQFIEIARSKFTLIISTFKNSALEKKIDTMGEYNIIGTGGLLSNVSDLIYLLGKMDFIITSDSGITHLAETLSIPCGSVFNVVSPEERTEPYIYNEDLAVDFEIPGVCKTPCYIHALKEDAECNGMKYMNDIAGEKVFWSYPPCLENLEGEHLYQLLELLQSEYR